MTVSDLKLALTDKREMDCYLEVRSTQEIIDDIKAFAPIEANALRDQFAGMALPAVLEQIYLMLRESNSETSNVPHVAAVFSYEVADAMLKAREVKS